ncbi:hypothetical protein C8Q74DRAFT_716493 [Fomes fomentarius]|nr:hypothetical protein C8Q74DRAFT_716493 [Fomes fomentarius]
MCCRLKVFVFYAYFGQVCFATLKSQKGPDDNKSDPKKEGPGPKIPKRPSKPPSCSPKSMYRLADKYGVKGLKWKAAEDIRSKLTVHDILTELFSPFTVMHPDIIELEMTFLFDHIKESDALLSGLPKWLQLLEKGELPDGASAVFAKLFEKMASAGRLQKCSRGCKASVIITCGSCGRRIE